jgi:rare lipoprotein A
MIERKMATKVSQRRRAFLAFALQALAFSGCHKKRVSALAPAGTPAASSRTPTAAAPTPGAVETGIASWYGHPYHGRQSASGEIYDMEQLTAAHRTLPFNTWVRVENVANAKTVDVRINDRGPFVGGRIIDISHAAAQAIEMIGPGTAQVRVTVIGAPAIVEPAIFGVQVGAFQNRDNAEHLKNELEDRYGAARLVMRAGTPPLWRVLVGRESTTEGASALAQRIREERNVPEAFVVRVDETPL